MKRKKKNIVLEKLLVEDYAAEGKSLARVDGKVIFIENVVPGDVVDVRLLKNKKDWAEGIPLQVHSFSPQQVPGNKQDDPGLWKEVKVTADTDGHVWVHGNGPVPSEHLV